ncbi:hypothetical protein GDO78_021228 [Eleutherodactylus coqui]|uniref:Uncharacterized protein n=1 Tax=Eleutherodactylus coqui TaxID=57060 RepID=A0A8J6EN87_ELECQ|nr:hypothetical protein GDO78_021228 [Eleutherodactylus coqui]
MATDRLVDYTCILTNAQKYVDYMEMAQCCIDQSSGFICKFLGFLLIQSRVCGDRAAQTGVPVVPNGRPSCQFSLSILSRHFLYNYSVLYKILV